MVSYFLLIFVILCVSFCKHFYSITDNFNIWSSWGSESVAFTCAKGHLRVLGWALIVSQYLVDVDLGKPRGTKLRMFSTELVFLLQGAGGWLFDGAWLSPLGRLRLSSETLPLPQFKSWSFSLHLHLFESISCLLCLFSVLHRCFSIFAFVLCFSFKLDSSHFNTTEMQWKLFSCKSFYFQARRLFRDYLIYPPAGSGCLCDIFFTLGL